MRRLKVADRDLLVGDDAADLLLEYAALIASVGRGDSVQLQALLEDGSEVTFGILLNSGTAMLVESVVSRFDEPRNEVAEQYLRERLAVYTGPGRSPVEADA